MPGAAAGLICVHLHVRGLNDHVSMLMPNLGKLSPPTSTPTHGVQTSVEMPLA